MSGKLFICGLPIGNDADISRHALQVLNEVDLIAAEDTRSAALLLSRFGVKKN